MDIIGNIKDIIHLLLFRKPLWNDAMRCDKLLCRFCGGKFGRQNKD